jgi:hypothetical protein
MGFTLANMLLSQSGEMFGPARRTNKVLRTWAGGRLARSTHFTSWLDGASIFILSGRELKADIFVVQIGGHAVAV